MKNIIVRISTLTIIAGTFAFAAAAQKTFMLPEASVLYDVRVTIASCSDSSCEGAATVELFRKSTTKLFQKIEMENLYLELGDDQKPTANVVELYGDNSGVVFDDFNFDGRQDLALRAGNYGSYGGPSYDILVYSARQRKFVDHRKLTVLASENLGLFMVDRKARTLTTFTKSGCCWHKTERYVIRNNQPVKVFIMTEDATRADGKVAVTTSRLVKGRWRKSTKLYDAEKYYK